MMPKWDSSFRDGSEGPDPESRDSPMRNCASEVRCFASPRNDGGIVRALYSSQHDHVLARLIGVKPLHQARTALQPRALIDVALVGQLVTVDRGRLDHQ